jgi:hypothetical protein
MQTRDYDDYIYSSSTLGYRKVSDDGLEIDVNQETDGYFNLYADSISVSYLHSMDMDQINAIHYFEENTEQIFITLLEHLSKMYTNPKQELGFKHVNVLNENKQDYCFTEFTFIDAQNIKVTIKMHKDCILSA